VSTEGSQSPECRLVFEFVEANEAEPIAYSIYIDEDGSRMTVMQI
jgi:hypothetical protein